MSKPDAFYAAVARICDQIAATLQRPPRDDPRRAIVELLDRVLAAERACAQRYHREYQLAAALHGESAAEGFLRYANEEREHVSRVAARIAALGSQARAEEELESPVEQSGDEAFEDLMQADFEAEKLLIETYGALARWLEPHDAETAAMMRGLADDEQRHLTAP